MGEREERGQKRGTNYKEEDRRRGETGKEKNIGEETMVERRGERRQEGKRQ